MWLYILYTPAVAWWTSGSLVPTHSGACFSWNVQLRSKIKWRSNNSRWALLLRHYHGQTPHQKYNTAFHMQFAPIWWWVLLNPTDLTLVKTNTLLYILHHFVDPFVWCFITCIVLRPFLPKWFSSWISKEKSQISKRDLIIFL